MTAGLPTQTNATGKGSKTVREYLEKHYVRAPAAAATAPYAPYDWRGCIVQTEEIAADDRLTTKLAVQALLEVAAPSEQGKTIEVAIMRNGCVPDGAQRALVASGYCNVACTGNQ